VRTTTEFLREAVGHRWFREARHNVRFVDEMLAERERGPEPEAQPADRSCI
jgi:hypothetical protein